MSQHVARGESSGRDRRPRAEDVGGRNRGDDATPADPIDRSPARASTAIAVVFAVLAAVVLPSTFALGVGLAGATIASVGAVIGSRRGLGYGTLLLLGGVGLAGIQGSAPEPLVLATLLALLAWDVGRYGITIGEQLGRDAETIQVELAHAALSTAIGAAGAGLGYAAYLVVAGGQPVAALALLLFGAVLLVVTLR